MLEYSTMADIKSMAGLNKENTNPVTCTTTVKKPKQNRLKANTPKRNVSGNGPPFKPKDNIKPKENDQIQEVIEIKDNTDQKTTTVGQDSLLTESDVANAVFYLMNGQQLASDLDDIDYTTTRGLFKRKGTTPPALPPLQKTTKMSHHPRRRALYSRGSMI